MVGRTSRLSGVYYTYSVVYYTTYTIVVICCFTIEQHRERAERGMREQHSAQKCDANVFIKIAPFAFAERESSEIGEILSTANFMRARVHTNNRRRRAIKHNLCVQTPTPPPPHQPRPISLRTQHNKSQTENANVVHYSIYAYDPVCRAP